MSIARRELLAGIAGTFCCSPALAQWPNGQVSSPTSSAAPLPLEGCMIGKLSDISYTLWGDREEERATEEVFNSSSAYLDVLDGTVAVFDGPDSFNALATPQNLLIDRGEGTVLIGRQLINSHRRAFGSQWLAALAMSVAHETAHLKQYASHLDLPKRLSELHADFLAGWTLQRFGLRPDRQKYSDASVAIRSLSMMQRANSAVHGSASDRVQSVNLGWYYADAHMSPWKLMDPPVVEALRILQAH